MNSISGKNSIFYDNNYATVMIFLLALIIQYLLELISSIIQDFLLPTWCLRYLIALIIVI